MNVFIIHSGKDKQIVDQKAAEIRRGAYGFNALVLKNGGKLWKIGAKRKIKKAQMVVFFVGETSHESENIAWELETAIKLGKPVYTVKLDPEYEDHPALNKTDEFSGHMNTVGREVDIEELKRIVNDYEEGNYDIFNHDLKETDKSILFEQYKIFLQTSEDLVSRRQSLNNFYISINSAIVALYTCLLTFNFELRIKLLAGAIFALIGIILSVSWMKILTSYGNLNSSKMKIIRSIEKQLPASLYDAEWAALSDKLNEKRYVSFTNSEKRIPIIFILVYSCMGVGMLAAFLAGIIK